MAKPSLPHTHDYADRIDPALESDRRGIWAVKVSLAGLGIAAIFQLAVVFISGSIALFADTIHNFGDAMTAIPLWIAFAIARRPASRRYTYGLGRAEDLAGVFVVLVIASSLTVALVSAVQRLIHPQPVHEIGWLIVAALIGFAGNEAVAVFRIRVGREIGSAALVADGYHARIDGFTSLSVVVAAVGIAMGFPLADPIVGILISIVLVRVLKDAARDVWHRLMDAVDPSIVERVHSSALRQRGVYEVAQLRVRWLGHRLSVQLQIVVDGRLTTAQGHGIAEAVRHAIFHADSRISDVSVHVDPFLADGTDAHITTRHHSAPMLQPAAISKGRSVV